jgi:hypothetical protein
LVGLAGFETDLILIRMLADRLHMHESGPESVLGCPRVTVTVPGRLP